MNCPYPDCSKKKLPKGTNRCPQCRRFIKPCRQCKELNRALSRFCRACGRRLVDSQEDWLGYKGGPERCGLNRYRHPKGLRNLTLKELLRLDLEDPCCSLLSCEGLLIAISECGIIEAADLAGSGRPIRWRADGAVCGQPCVERGSLYIGGENWVAAYSLAGLTRTPPRLEPRWTVRLQGTPMHSLLAQEGRLYLNVGFADGTRQVQVIDNIDGPQPSRARILFSSRILSSLVGSPPPGKWVSFLSQENGDTVVYRVEHQESTPKYSKKPIKGAPRPLRDHVPIAAIGKKIFAVFGDDDLLCRIDAEDAVFDVGIHPDTKRFALSGLGDGIVVHTAALFFIKRNAEEALSHLDRVKGPPVILKDRAALLGFQNGRLRVHDLNNPAFYQEHSISDKEFAAVTALASFRDYIAAGSDDGTVKLLKLVESESSGKS